MKLGKIGALCKAYKRFVVYNVGHGNQWISDGYAAYPLYELPPLSEDNVFAIFDIPEDKRGKMYFDERTDAPLGVNFADSVEDEVEIRACAIGIIWQGAIYLPFKSREGVLFVDKKYLSPFEEIPVLYERWTPGGTPYIVAKRGMLLEGIITPAGIATSELADLLCEVVEQTAEVAVDNTSSERDVEAPSPTSAEEPEQEEMEL